MPAPIPQPVCPEPQVVRPPDADPVAIRVFLIPDVAAMFRQGVAFVLEEAKQSKDLAGVRELLQQWRHFAHQELREPGAYFRLTATVARTQATRQVPTGSVSGEEIRARSGSQPTGNVAAYTALVSFLRMLSIREATC